MIMRARGMSRARLLFYEAALLVFLIFLAGSFRAYVAAPVFQDETRPQEPGIRVPSVFDLIWQGKGMPQKVLRAGFPMLRYMEDMRTDSGPAGLVAQAAGWLMGFIPRDIADLAFGQLAGFLAEYEPGGGFGVPVELEQEWGVTPVLYTLPPGDDMIAASLGLSGQPLVAIYHTHATESYLPELGKKAPADAFTADMSKSVVKLGELLLQELERRYRIPCLHSKTVHDSDSRIGAYYRSDQTVQAVLKKYPECKVLIDLHRDSQRRNLTAVTIRGKSYARLLFVIGTDNSGWVSNYNSARRIQSRLEEAYPGISRGFLYSSAFYNQQYSPSAILVEVGGVDNTLAECRNSMEALAWALAATLLPAAPTRP